MSSATTALTNPTADDVDAGTAIANAGPSFTVKANRSWTLKIKSQNAASWTTSAANCGVKPIGDLAWATSAGGTLRRDHRQRRDVHVWCKREQRRGRAGFLQNELAERLSRAQAMLLVPTACRSCSPSRLRN